VQDKHAGLGIRPQSVEQPLGGALFGLGRAFPFVFDAVSYLVSFVALLTIRVPLQEDTRPERRSIRAEIAEGLQTVWSQPFLRAAVVIVSGQNFAWNALTLVMIVRAQDLGAEPALIGLMFAFSGAGSLLGAVVAPWIQARVPTRVLVVAIAWLWAAQFAVQAALADVIALGIAAGVGSIAGPIFNVAFGAVVYRVTPDRLLGRVRSVVKVVAWGTIPLGSLAAGVLAAGVGAQMAIAVLAVVMVAIAFVTSFARGVREIPDR
jgi:predicted MFS family arabinose efflux permease